MDNVQKANNFNTNMAIMRTCDAGTRWRHLLQDPEIM
jgi:hypothetical protein